MKFVCLWSPSWSTGAGPAPELVAAFLEVVPRVVVEGRGVVWADLRGISGVWTAEALLALATAGVSGDVVRAGLAAVPIVAEVAARDSSRSSVACGASGAGDGGVVVASPMLRVVGPGRERDFLAPLPLSLLASASSRPSISDRAGVAPRGRRTSRRREGSAPGPDQRLLALLDGVGLRCCGELAVLDLAAVEVRFGVEGVRLWRLARADDPRHLFPPIPPERPHASLDFIDYQVTDPERLIFTINALLENLTRTLRGRGEHARRLRLTFTLADGGAWHRSLRPARPTASREVWLRLARGVLERSAIPDAVVGLALEVEALEPAAVQQGDLFDRGFASAGAVEAALARLLERQGEILVMPRHTGHPLPERRVEWVVVDPFTQISRPEVRPTRGRPPLAQPIGGGGDRGESGDRGGERPDTRASGEACVGVGNGLAPEGPRLSLHLLAEPQPIEVETEQPARAGPAHDAPLRYRDSSGWNKVLTASGPDRISGGQWEETYAREYFRCITEKGELVWLFHDPRRGGWFLHGWWG